MSLDNHFENLNARHRFVPDGPTPCGLPSLTDAHRLEHSRGVSFSWTCSCSAMGRAESLEHARSLLADHLASQTPDGLQAAYRRMLESFAK